MGEAPSDLISLLNSSNPRDRRLAVEDLPMRMGVESLSLLTRALSDPEISVRETAIESLGELKGAECCQMILPLLQADNASTRNAAFEVLCRQADHACPFVLQEALKASDPDVRKFGLDILKAVPSPTLELTRDIISAATRLLDDADVNVAGAAADVMGHHGSRADIPVLLGHLQSSMWMQCCIISALQTMKDPEAHEALDALDTESLDPLALIFWQNTRQRKSS